MKKNKGAAPMRDGYITKIRRPVIGQFKDSKNPLIFKEISFNSQPLLEGLCKKTRLTSSFNESEECPCYKCPKRVGCGNLYYQTCPVYQSWCSHYVGDMHRGEIRFDDVLSEMRSDEAFCQLPIEDQYQAVRQEYNRRTQKHIWQLTEQKKEGDDEQ